MTRSALAIPVAASSAINQEVEALWTELANPDITDATTLEQALKFNPALQKLKAFPVLELRAAIERRRIGTQEDGGAVDLKFPEWERFIDPKGAPIGNDFTISSAGLPASYSAEIEQFVAVTRLRETTALVGFVRVDPPDSALMEDAEDSPIVPLTSGVPYWVPAADVRGEGIFVQLPDNRIRAWETTAQEHPRMLG